MERLILCGGGHVAQQVAWLAGRLDFDIVVIDDRPELANAQRFPGVQVLCMPYLEALDSLDSRDSDYYVLLSRGHTIDRDCLEHVLQNKAYAYVGMIGSRVKIAAVRKALEEAGISQDMLDRVHAPIGLSIGARTPAEIAVSIAAELIQTRAQRGPEAVRPPDGPGVLCTIVKKNGSAPRDVGTWMLVRPDGVCVGTIGGGQAEYQVKLDALDLWARGGSRLRKSYGLIHAAAELGIAGGGGRIEVEFEVRRA